MATIYNSDLIKELTDVAKLQTSREAIPTQIAEKIVPVIDVNPKHSRLTNLYASSTRTATAAASIFTTSAVKDTYITGITLSYTANAAADNTSVYVDAIPFGETSVNVLVLLPKQTTTAISDNITVQFANPIRLARNTAVRHGSTFTAGACTYNTNIFGFTVENINA